jgi:PAS domain S-box-containing protein
MKNFFSHYGKTVTLITCCCLIIILCIWSTLLRQVNADRQETIKAAVQRNANLAVALEQYTIRTIHNADAVIQLVKLEFEKNGKQIDFANLIHHHIIDKHFFNGIAVIDEKGKIAAININNDSIQRLELSDREYFRFHLNSSIDELHISKPVISRTLKKAVIILSRRITKDDGTFGGIVAVQIEPSVFTQFYADANLREHDIVSLISLDGITFSRRTGLIESFGEDIKKSPLFTHLKNRPIANYFAKDAIRNIPTYFSYRKLAQHPIIATVGASEANILAAFHQRATGDYASGVMISLLLVVFSVLVSILLIHRKKHLDKIRENETKYRSIFENSRDAILLLQPNGQILAINKAGSHIFKMKEIIMLDKSIQQLTAFEESGNRLFSNGVLAESFEGELSFLRSDGDRFTGEVASNSYVDVAGIKQHIVMIRDITERKRLGSQLLNEQKRFERKLTEQIILAQEREREKIGHELHDNVNQILTTVKLYLEMANTNPELRTELLPKSIHYIMECIDEIRNLSRELSAPTLGTKSLVDSLKALVESVQSSSGLKVNFSHDRYKQPLNKDQKLALYRITQEQLNNIIKHAKAGNVFISLDQIKNKTILTIKDDGRGFDTSVQPAGIGLNNILSRTKVLGGELHITSKQGEGCLLQVYLPTTISETENANNPAFRVLSNENN